jgi:hypothetical protein
MNDSTLKSLKIITAAKEKVDLAPPFSPKVLQYKARVSSKVHGKSACLAY